MVVSFHWVNENGLLGIDREVHGDAALVPGYQVPDKWLGEALGNQCLD